MSLRALFAKQSPVNEEIAHLHQHASAGVVGKSTLLAMTEVMVWQKSFTLNAILTI
jgi:hypothetical protein